MHPYNRTSNGHPILHNNTLKINQKDFSYTVEFLDYNVTKHRKHVKWYFGRWVITAPTPN